MCLGRARRLEPRRSACAPLQRLARRLVLVCAHQAQPFDECRCVVSVGRGPTSCSSSSARSSTPGVTPSAQSSDKAELRQEHARAGRGRRCPPRPEPTPAPASLPPPARGEETPSTTRGMTISALSRGSASASTNACSRSRSDSLQIVDSTGSPSRRNTSARSAPGCSCSSSGSRISTRPLRVPAREVMVGREQLPAAPDRAAGIARRERDRQLGQLRCRPRSATRGRSRRSGLQFVGDLGRRPVRAESKMPGALLRIADQLREPAMQRSPPARVELRLDARRQQGVAETNTLVVQLQDRRSLGCAKPPAHRRRVGCRRLDDRDRRLAEQRDRLEHLANILRQRRQPRRDEIGERRRNRQPLTRARTLTRLLERAPELERIERIPARRLVKLDKRRSRKRDAETLAQQTMSRADTQRAEPQPPQPFARKRAIEPERSRAPRRCCGVRRESRPAPPQAAEARTRAPTPTPHRATARHQPQPSAARRRAQREAGTPRTRSPAHPAQTPRPPPATEPPKAPDAAAPATARAPPAAPGSRDRRAPQTRTPPRHPPDGKRRPRNPAPAPPPPSRRTASSSRCPPRRPARAPWGVSRPAARKSASTAASSLTADNDAALPYTPLVAHGTAAGNPDACQIRILARRHS